MLASSTGAGVGVELAAGTVVLVAVGGAATGAGDGRTTSGISNIKGKMPAIARPLIQREVKRVLLMAKRKAFERKAQRGYAMPDTPLGRVQVFCSGL